MAWTVPWLDSTDDTCCWRWRGGEGVLPVPWRKMRGVVCHLLGHVFGWSIRRRKMPSVIEGYSHKVLNGVQTLLP